MRGEHVRRWPDHAALGHGHVGERQEVPHRHVVAQAAGEGSVDMKWRSEEASWGKGVLGHRDRHRYGKMR